MIDREPDPKTTDYCTDCGESPESGTHVFGHDYVPPAYLTTAEETKAAVLAATANIPGIVPESVRIEVVVDEYEEYDVGEDNTPPSGALDVDATWREIRRPVASLAEFRTIVQDGSVTEDIAIDAGRFVVTNEDAAAVASFAELEDARAFLSARAVLNLWAAAERRAELAESRVRGLEHLVKQLHEYDQEYSGKAVDGAPDAHARLMPDFVDDEDERCIAVVPEDLDDLDDPDDEVRAKDFWVSPREARCLAASLLRAACQAEEALARRARGEVTSEDPEPTT